MVLVPLLICSTMDFVLCSLVHDHSQDMTKGRGICYSIDDLQKTLMCRAETLSIKVKVDGEGKDHIPLKTAFASANFCIANAENDAQTT